MCRRKRSKRVKPDTAAVEIFFDLLANALWGREYNMSLYENVSTECWKSVVDIALRQTVQGNVYDAVIGLPRQYMPPRDIVITLLAHAERIELYYDKILNVGTEISRKLDEAGINHVIVKGITSAAAYPVPEHRVQGDIDIYFPDGGCDKAQELLFGTEGEVKKTLRHLSGRYKGVAVENHFRLTHHNFPLYMELEKELNDLVRSVGISIMSDNNNYYPLCVTFPDFNVIFMIEHAAAHFPASGLGMRHVCDWGRQLSHYRDDINKDYVAGIIKKYRLERFSNALGIICVDKLGMPQSDYPAKLVRSRRSMRDAAYVEKVIMEGGNFGKYYDGMHSVEERLKLSGWRRIFVSFIIFARDIRKYIISSPGLYVDILREKILKALRLMPLV